jgi:flavorubredoxin
LITNSQSGTSLDEVAEQIFRISTPLPAVPGGFTFSQYLIADDAPLLFHTGPRATFRFVCEAIERILPVAGLRYISFSHFESDECGALNQFLAKAPEAVPVCSRVNALVNADAWDRKPQPIADGEALELGRHKLQWFDMPHLPHAWECGYLFDSRTRTLLCGDLFTQGGAGKPALTGKDILEPSEALRSQMDYFAHTDQTRAQLEKLARTEPRTLACMHGSAWEGDGAKLLRELGGVLERR